MNFYRVNKKWLVDEKWHFSTTIDFDQMMSSFVDWINCHTDLHFSPSSGDREPRLGNNSAYCMGTRPATSEEIKLCKRKIAKDKVKEENRKKREKESKLKKLQKDAESAGFKLVKKVKK
jgi:hypothetical protein